MKAKETKRRGETIKKGKGRRMGQEEEEKKKTERAQVKTSELQDQNEFIKEENENVKVSQGKPATKLRRLDFISSFSVPPSVRNGRK